MTSPNPKINPSKNTKHFYWQRAQVTAASRSCPPWLSLVEWIASQTMSHQTGIRGEFSHETNETLNENEALASWRTRVFSWGRFEEAVRRMPLGPHPGVAHPHSKRYGFIFYGVLSRPIDGYCRVFVRC